MKTLRVIDSQQEPINANPFASGPAINMNRFAAQWREARQSNDPKKLARFKEVMTSDTFAHIADITDRALVVGQEQTPIQTNYADIGYRQDTTTLSESGSMYRLNLPQLLDRVAQKGEYTSKEMTDDEYNFSTDKYGNQMDFSWEAWLEDDRDLGAIADKVEAWGASVPYTRQYVFTNLYAANTTIFTAAHGNLGTGANSALSRDALETAIVALLTMEDPAGDVGVYAGSFNLVVPPQLKFTAREITESPLIITGEGTTLPNVNVYEGEAKVIVDHFLPSVDAAYGTSGWYVFCDPAIRPAFRYGYLRGYEEAQLFIRSADAQRIASGTEDPFDGSFLDDDIAFKIRMTFGANEVDYRGAYFARGE